MQAERYNGWANYETWAVGLFLDGNYDGEGTYREVLDIVASAAADFDQENVDEGIWTVEQAQRFSVEDSLKSWTRDVIETGVEGIAADLLGAALDSVDWTELAEHKLAEVRESAEDQS